MIEVVLLGIAQDAGVPQAGCNCTRCRGARRNPDQRERVVSLGIVDRASSKYWIIDATPDFRDQFGFMVDYVPDFTLGGIFLTHLHMGHYTGLIHLGEEAANLKAVSLYCTETVGDFLQVNAPWSTLLDHGHLKITQIGSDAGINLSDSLRIHPIEVPHRATPGETLAFAVQGPRRRLFFCPDIDTWSRLRGEVPAFIAGFDIALLDGSFYQNDEVPGRSLAEIPHPLIVDTMDLLEGVDCEIFFVHLNHTNPLLGSEEIQDFIAGRGFHVGFEGQIWDLSLES